MGFTSQMSIITAVQISFKMATLAPQQQRECAYRELPRVAPEAGTGNQLPTCCGDFHVARETKSWIVISSGYSRNK